MNIFGEDEFKPVIRFGKVLPDYHASKDGRVWSEKRNRFMTSFAQYYKKYSGEKKLSLMRFAFTIPDNLYEDHKHRKTSTSRNVCKIDISAHRVVAETWMPIDEYPPVPKEVWDKSDELMKQCIRDLAIVDHKDNNPRNNHVDNLQWVTPKENEFNRKKAQ
tara:strand:+ start:84 stop:566 length:483 start_codon:yes stop_codon:yes gene_type:complete